MEPTFSNRLIQEYRQVYQEIWGKDRFYQEEIISPALRKYEEEFRQEVQDYERPATWKEIQEQAQRSDIIYIGDFHPLRRAKLMAREILWKGRKEKGSPFLLLEEFKSRHQNYLDDYLASRIDADTLKAKTKNGQFRIGRTSWQGIISLLDLAKAENIPVYGVDVTEKNLRERDFCYSGKIKEIFQENDNSQIFFLAGTFHLAEKHLPQLVRKGHSRLRPLTIFQGIEDIFWKLLEEGRAHKTFAVKIREGSYCLNHIPPLILALVYENSFKDPKVQASSKELMENYKVGLYDLLNRLLKPNGGPEPDLEKIKVEDLERLVYSGQGERVIRREFQRLFERR